MKKVKPHKSAVYFLFHHSFVTKVWCRSRSISTLGNMFDSRVALVLELTPLTDDDPDTVALVLELLLDIFLRDRAEL